MTQDDAGEGCFCPRTVLVAEEAGEVAQPWPQEGLNTLALEGPQEALEVAQEVLGEDKGVRCPVCTSRLQHTQDPTYIRGDHSLRMHLRCRSCSLRFYGSVCVAGRFHAERWYAGPAPTGDLMEVV